MENYAQHAEPLHTLTRKDAVFQWDDRCQESMDILKKCVTSAPLLTFPDFTRPFSIHTDACDLGLGAALMQKDREGEGEKLLWPMLVVLFTRLKDHTPPQKKCFANLGSGAFQTECGGPARDYFYRPQ